MPSFDLDYITIATYLSKACSVYSDFVIGDRLLIAKVDGKDLHIYILIALRDKPLICSR